MRKWIPGWVYTSSLPAMLWILCAWLTFRTLDTMQAMAHLSAMAMVALALQSLSLLLLSYVVLAGAKVARNKPQQQLLARPPRRRCYLVVHLNLKVSPPAVAFVHTYSCSAKDLTHTGAREARADLYMVEDVTFQDALDEMRRIQPLYFPWATPYLTRNR